jgi:hypothetical protein
MIAENHSDDRHAGPPPAGSPSRAQCPPAKVIVDYGLNDTTDDVRMMVDEHLRDEGCPYCAMELRALRAALTAKLGPPSSQDPTLDEGG